MDGDASSSAAARQSRAACILALILAIFRRLSCSAALVCFIVSSGAAAQGTLVGAPQAGATGAALPAVPLPLVPPAVRTPQAPAKPTLVANTRPATKAAVTNPSWKELSPVQQEALAPLASQWDKLDALHRAKWLRICHKFDAMSADEKARIQERMRAWVALTPEQRRIARDIYVRTKKLNTGQKSAQWEQYQQLPEEQKRRLAAEAAKTKVVALPAVHSKPKVVPPIKLLPKPALQQSVSPQSVAAQGQTRNGAGRAVTTQPGPPAVSAAAAGQTASSAISPALGAARALGAVEPKSVVTPRPATSNGAP